MSAGQIAGLVFAGTVYLVGVVGVFLWNVSEYRDNKGYIKQYPILREEYRDKMLHAALTVKLCWAWPALLVMKSAAGLVRLWATVSEINEEVREFDKRAQREKESKR